MAFHVVTVVPDPIRMIAEAKRVCKPGGRIVIVNHFTSDVPLLGSLTQAMDPITRWLGWRTIETQTIYLFDPAKSRKSLQAQQSFPLHGLALSKREKRLSTARANSKIALLFLRASRASHRQYPRAGFGASREDGSARSSCTRCKNNGSVRTSSKHNGRPSTANSTGC